MPRGLWSYSAGDGRPEKQRGGGAGGGKDAGCCSQAPRGTGGPKTRFRGKLRECLQVGTAAHHQVLLWGHQLSQAHSFPLLPWLPSTCPVIRVALGVPAWLTVPSPGLQGWVCRGTPLGQTHPLGSKTWPPPLGPGPRLHLLPLPALSGTVVFLSLQVPAAASSPGSLWNPPRCAPARRAPTWRHPSSSQTLTPPRICSDPYTDELLKMQIPGNHQHHWPCSMHAVQPRARTRS